MKINLFYLIIAAIAFLPLQSVHAGGETTFGGVEADNYYHQLENAIAKEEQKVKVLQDRASSRTQMPMWIDKLELEQAIIMLDVKKILYNNFRNTPSMDSPIIRDKLLSLLNQDNISEGDLAELQSLVNRERLHQIDSNQHQMEKEKGASTNQQQPSEVDSINIVK